jgi:hypothetical protein
MTGEPGTHQARWTSSRFLGPEASRLCLSGWARGPSGAASLRLVKVGSRHKRAPPQNGSAPLTLAPLTRRSFRSATPPGSGRLQPAARPSRSVRACRSEMLGRALRLALAGRSTDAGAGSRGPGATVLAHGVAHLDVAFGRRGQGQPFLHPRQQVGGGLRRRSGRCAGGALAFEPAQRWPPACTRPPSISYRAPTAPPQARMHRAGRQRFSPTVAVASRVV